MEERGGRGRGEGEGRESTPDTPSSVGSIADLYLGNILYALERCAMALADDGDAEGAAYYRALARSLAEARGRATAEGGR
jgi:hypothetical protein